MSLHDIPEIEKGKLKYELSHCTQEKKWKDSNTTQSDNIFKHKIEEVIAVNDT